VDVPRQRNSREENACIKKGEIPASFEKEDKNGRKSKLAQKDTDARWMTKSGERHFGYKNHINADPNTKLIARYNVSSASPHDSTEIENIVDKADSKLHADSAYRSKKIEAFLEDIKCESFVHEKGYKNNHLLKSKSSQIKLNLK
ncbi:MAG: IS5 family transposase, partial [Francisella sp.]